MTTEVFPFKDPSEVQTLAFDFSPDLGTETLAAPLTVGVELLAGTDASPNDIINGSPVIVGSTVVQSVTGGVSNCDYRIWSKAQTSGGRTLVVAGVLPVRDA
jgi:hypothetical protein